MTLSDHMHISGGFRTAYLCIVVFVMVNLSFGGLFCVVSFRKEIAHDLGSSVFVIGLLYGVYFFVSSFSGKFLLPYIGKLRIKSLCLIGCLGLVVGYAICRHTDSVLVFNVSFVFFIAFLGGTPFLIPLAGFAMSSLPSRPAFALAVATVGQLTTFGFWAWVLSTWWPAASWRDVLFYIEVVTTVGLLVCIVLMPNSKNELSRKSRVLAPQTPWLFAKLLFISYACAGFCGTIIITNVERLEHDIKMVTTTHWGYPAFSIGAIVGRLMAALLFDSGFKSSTVIGSFFVLFASLILACMKVDSALFLVCMALFGAAYGGVLPTILCYGQSAYPMRSSEVSASMFYWGCSGLAAGSVVSALGGTLVTYLIPMALGLSFVSLVLTTAFSVLIARHTGDRIEATRWADRAGDRSGRRGRP